MNTGTADGDAPEVVIVGPGFGGLAAAKRLARAGARTTLIDCNVYSTFQPLLYQLATTGLTSSDVAYPVRSASRGHHAAFRPGELTSIDPVARQITLADGTTLGYDYLILAAGVRAAYHGVPGAAEHSLGLCTRRDAIVLRDRLLAGLGHLSRSGPDADVSVTVIGGGATGVELAGSLADLRNLALDASYPEIDPARVHVSLWSRGDPCCSRRSTPGCASTRAVSWPGGASRSCSARPSPRSPPARSCSPTGTSWPATSQCGRPEWRPRPRSPAGACRKDPAAVFAPDPTCGSAARTGSSPSATSRSPATSPCRSSPSRPCSGAATPRTRSAPFRYRDKGIMATIGYRSAVVQLPGRVRIRGTLAWLAWLALRLATLSGGRNQISALVNLSWRYLTWRRGGGLILGDDR